MTDTDHIPLGYPESEGEQPDLFKVPPEEPNITFLEIHQHEWVEIGAKQNPNGTWSSVWSCNLCPDIGVGGEVGPVPPGYCFRCGWVQKTWPRKRCESCRTQFPEG